MPIIESKLELRHAVYDLTLPAGEPWLHEIKRGQIFRIVDLEGNQAVDTLFYNAHDPPTATARRTRSARRRNLYLTDRHAADVERAATSLLTIVADTCGRHDTLGGACAAESNMVRYALEKRHMHACRDSFLQAIALHVRRGHAPRQARHRAATSTSS